MFNKNRKYIIVTCFFISSIFSMQQRNQLLTRELVVLSNNLNALEQTLKDKKIYEFTKKFNEALCSETILLSLIEQGLMPTLIDTPAELVSILQTLTNIGQTSRAAYDMLTKNNLFLGQLKKIFIRKLRSPSLIAEAFDDIKNEKIKIYKSLRDMLEDIEDTMYKIISYTSDLKRSTAKMSSNLKKLFDEGYSPDILNNDNLTLLEYAIQLFYTVPQLTIIDFLLANGANINSVTPQLKRTQKEGFDSDLKTPLSFALQYNLFALANYLLEQGADPLINSNVKYEIDSKAANMPSNYVHIKKLIRLLVQKGVDPNSMLTKNTTMLDYAKQIGDEELVQFLSQ